MKPIAFEQRCLPPARRQTGIQIPDDAIERLGGGKRPAIRVTINGYTYRSTAAVMGGKFMVGISAERREDGREAAEAD